MGRQRDRRAAGAARRRPRVRPRRRDCAYRQDEVTRGHPVRKLRVVLRRSGRLAEIEVEPLAAAGTASSPLASSRRRSLPRSWPSLHDRTQGIPFFVEELVAALAARGCSPGSRRARGACRRGVPRARQRARRHPAPGGAAQRSRPPGPRGRGGRGAPVRARCRRGTGRARGLRGGFCARLRHRGGAGRPLRFGTRSSGRPSTPPCRGPVAGTFTGAWPRRSIVVAPRPGSSQSIGWRPPSTIVPEARSSPRLTRRARSMRTATRAARCGRRSGSGGPTTTRRAWI